MIDQPKLPKGGLGSVGRGDYQVLSILPFLHSNSNVCGVVSANDASGEDRSPSTPACFNPRQVLEKPDTKCSI